MSITKQNDSTALGKPFGLQRDPGTTRTPLGTIETRSNPGILETSMQSLRDQTKERSLMMRKKNIAELGNVSDVEHKDTSPESAPLKEIRIDPLDLFRIAQSVTSVTTMMGKRNPKKAQLLASEQCSKRYQKMKRNAPSTNSKLRVFNQETPESG